MQVQTNYHLLHRTCILFALDCRWRISTYL